ncbi:NAD(P)-binding protein [Lentinula edodes]|uniref:NAD(P)-binding protein n=1 Tax=Lentinula edodes TaxID=5353 RepID=UPI001E8CFB34|nr:NAD(P)-binding protein [Lentinula edodes]KAH7879400.1 NAD(P)-binding protein [Lentinula edodes]
MVAASFWTLFRQFFPPASKWSFNDMPDLTGKVAIVTGGNVGIGKETCKQLLIKGCTVWLAARSQSKAEQAIAELKEETGKEALFLELDLSDLKAVKESAEKFKRLSPTLHMLICNAGVMAPPIEQLTAQGHDLTFGVNVLGHFLFIQKLLPLLKTTSNSLTDTRIVWVASSGQYYFNDLPVNYDNLKDTPSRTKLGVQKSYTQSKFITVMLGIYMGKILAEDQDSNVICIHLDPGNIQSDLYRRLPSLLVTIMEWLVLKPTSMGAVTQLFAATAPEASQYNGKYLRPWARLGEPHPLTKDETEQKKMWDYCMAVVKEYE